MISKIVWLLAVFLLSAPIETYSFGHHQITHGKGLQRQFALKATTLVTNTSPPDVVAGASASSSDLSVIEKASICVVGGGVSGLTAAITAARLDKSKKIVLLEACERVGGRVQSDVTEDGFILDQGFAVFIEEYPYSKDLLDYDNLGLGKFLPGALVKVKGKDKLVRVSDPLRKPSDVLTALFAPIGSMKDKLKFIPLILHVRRKSIQDLFEEPETDTLTDLKEKWGFSEEIIDKFFRPFLEGIYLTPLENQSSRMFQFVFKMFSKGSAALPLGGMAAVARQLEEKAMTEGVDIRVKQAVSTINPTKDGSFIIGTSDGKTGIEVESVIVATDVGIAHKLISQILGLKAMRSQPTLPQRCVGCFYYSFEGAAPVNDPILILNGQAENRGPVNNICFPSVVNTRYAPPGFCLCSVTILQDTIDAYKGREKELDLVVREELSTWFPEYSSEIQRTWQLQKIYVIPNAQPAQIGKYAASINGGRPCNIYQDKELPHGVFVSGDHIATATLNGALESGVNAGKAAGRLVGVSTAD